MLKTFGSHFPYFFDYFSSFYLVYLVTFLIIIFIKNILQIKACFVANYLPKSSYSHDIILNSIITNLLLTELEGRTGEYWPEVVTVRTEHSEVRTKTTEGQYSPVRPEQARLVSSLLYGTLFLIVKWTSRGLHLKNVRLLHPSLKFRKNFNLFSFCW